MTYDGRENSRKWRFEKKSRKEMKVKGETIENNGVWSDSDEQPLSCPGIARLTTCH